MLSKRGQMTGIVQSFEQWITIFSKDQLALLGAN